MNLLLHQEKYTDDTHFWEVNIELNKKNSYESRIPEY